MPSLQVKVSLAVTLTMRITSHIAYVVSYFNFQSGLFSKELKHDSYILFVYKLCNVWFQQQFQPKI